MKNKSKEIIIESIEKNDFRTNKKYEFLEKDLHAFLSYFAFHNLKCYSKSINHSTSGKKEYGEWIHPVKISLNE